MRGIASELEFDDSIEAIADVRWVDVSNDGRIGADRIFHNRFSLPTPAELDDYLKSSWLTESDIHIVHRHEIVKTIFSAHYEGSLVGHKDSWTPKDLCDLILVKKPSFSFGYATEPRSFPGLPTGARILFAKPYTMHKSTYNSATPVTLFDIAARAAVNPIAISSRIFPETTVADVVNTLFVELDGEYHENKTQYGRTSDADIAEAHGVIRQHAKQGESSLWLSLVSWNIDTYMDIFDSTRLLTEHKADAYSILQCLRLSGLSSLDILRYYDDGYKADQMTPYFRAGITDEAVVRHAIDNDIDSELLHSL